MHIHELKALSMAGQGVGLLYMYSLTGRTHSPVHEHTNTVQGKPPCSPPSCPRLCWPHCPLIHLACQLLPGAPISFTPSHLKAQYQEAAWQHGRREMNEPGRLQRPREFSCGREELWALDPDLSWVVCNAVPAQQGTWLKTKGHHWDLSLVPSCRCEGWLRRCGGGEGILASPLGFLLP